MTKLHYLACAILIFNFHFSIFNSVQAQQHRERWKASDYFPENHFIPPNASDYDDSTHYADLAGEVAHYMRLAGLQPWWPVSDEALTLVRISMLPRYAHPIFVEVIILDDDSSAEIVYNRGSAICGYVEHTTYLDTAWVDVTEQHDHGNLWVEGKLYDSEYKPEIWLSGEELDSLKRLLVETDLSHHRHTTCYGGYRPKYVIEYLHDTTYNAVYDECYDKPLGTLVNYILSLVDTSWCDMYIYSPNKQNGIVPAQFPGGDSAFRAFVEANMSYPDSALRELEEATVSLKIVVERDGTFVEEGDRKSDGFGFHDEARRLLSLMPRWQPALDNGRPVRSYASCVFRFRLPDSLQPAYGVNPRLETHRDSSLWERLCSCNRRLSIHPHDQKMLYAMAMNYYDEFLLPRKPQSEPNYFDSICVDMIGGWDSFFDNTPVVDGAADSALRYFYRALEATENVDQENFISIYLPIRQLEQYFGLPHNPLNRLPYDTLPGMHYPGTYFVDLPPDGLLDTTVDYSGYEVLRHSFSLTKSLSHTLAAMSEPVLYDTTLAPGDTIFRCAFYPSFHPPLSFRIERTAEGAVLYWKKLDYTFDEQTFTTTLYPREGQRKLSRRKYRRLMRLWQELDFDHMPRKHYVIQIDGAAWCLERRTADSFKAHCTNQRNERIIALYAHLVRLADIDAPYAEKY